MAKEHIAEIPFLSYKNDFDRGFFNWFKRQIEGDAEDPFTSFDGAVFLDPNFLNLARIKRTTYKNGAFLDLLFEDAAYSFFRGRGYGVSEDSRKSLRLIHRGRQKSKKKHFTSSLKHRDLD